jgi:hypothetical protein
MDGAVLEEGLLDVLLGCERPGSDDSRWRAPIAGFCQDRLRQRRPHHLLGYPDFPAADPLRVGCGDRMTVVPQARRRRSATDTEAEPRASRRPSHLATVSLTACLSAGGLASVVDLNRSAWSIQPGDSRSTSSTLHFHLANAACRKALAVCKTHRTVNGIGVPRTHESTPKGA